jgi:hypothetical protein
MHRREGSLFTKCMGKLGITCRKMKLDSCLSPIPKINPKLMKDLNVRPETMKL